MRSLRNGGALWLVAWILAVPLVHVHPEADHRHGLPGHVHGGTFHTVFSPALRCATPDMSPEDVPGVSPARLGSPAPFGAGMHLGDHPTIGFSLLTSKINLVLVQHIDEAGLGSRVELPGLVHPGSPFEPVLEIPRWFVSTTGRSRAPPVLASA